LNPDHDSYRTNQRQRVLTGSSVAVVVVGCLVLYVAFKIGIVILKIALGLVALALLGSATWWFLSGMHH
jgi:hypothetical protein